jgi:prophage DNA circulation protein
MPLWEEYLSAASLGGVELPVVRRRLSGGWDGAGKELPHVNGKEFEPTGLRAEDIEIQVPLFADMESDEPLYPDRYELLVSVLKDDTTKGRLVWVDPVWGEMDVQVMSYSIDENSGERDGARVSIRMTQVGFELDTADLQLSVLARNDRGGARALASELDIDLADAGIKESAVEEAWAKAGVGPQSGEAISFAETVDAFFDDLDQGAVDVNDARALAFVPLSRIRAVTALSAARTSAAWPVADRAARLLAAVTEAAERAVGTRARLLVFRTRTKTTVWEIATRLYGDIGRVEEILQRNAIESPLFIPAGTRLIVEET